MNPIRKSMFNGQVSITRNVKRTCGGVKTINKNGAIKTSMFNGKLTVSTPKKKMVNWQYKPKKN